MKTLDDSRLISYPPLSPNGLEADDIFGHISHDCLTIMNTDEPRDSIQVLDTNGIWVNLTPVPGAFIVNIGDMLCVWTNEIYKSKMHRVIHNASHSRLSIIYSYMPTFGYEMKSIQKCIDVCSLKLNNLRLQESGGAKFY